MATKVVLPEMGEGVIEGTLARWLVSEGDHVDEFDPIAEVETDKVTTETTTDNGGTILKLCVAEGATIPVGTVLAYIGEPGEEIGAGEQGGKSGEWRVESGEWEGDSGEESRQLAVGSQRSVDEGSNGAGATAARERSVPYIGRISPVVGRIAAEHRVDLNRVRGTGRDGRITKKDILAFVEQRDNDGEEAAETAVAKPLPVEAKPTLRPQPAAEPTAAVPAAIAGETVPLTGIRRSIAEHMVRSKHTSPHVTTIFEIDFSAVAAHREAHKEQFARDGANLTYTAYMVATTAQALKQHPMVNSTWSDEGIVLRKEINIGVAAAIDDGLIVPVIKRADELNLLGLARAVNDLTIRARNRQLKPADVQGGTFSITNHGTSGSLFATPIINQPQCGILGVGMIEKRVKVINDAIAIRPLAYVGLTFDHRILDGASADGFVSTIKEIIENWH
jgi:2-oxoglutarate dehydrogenase E2 component (dihydrolipoamide succinyltransferase)